MKIKSIACLIVVFLSFPLFSQEKKPTAPMEAFTPFLGVWHVIARFQFMPLLTHEERRLLDKL